MSQTYVVVAEARGGKLRQVTLEAVQAARSAKREEDRVAAVLIGHAVEPLAAELAGYTDGPVHVVDHPDLELYNPETYATALEAALESLAPSAVFLGHTAIGRDLAPAIAARLGAGQISDVIAIQRDGGGEEASFTRPLYAGKAFETKRFVGDGVRVVTVRPNNFPAAEPAPAPGAVVSVAYSAPSDLRTVVKDVVRKMSGKVDLTEAKIVVSGGRGVKSAEGFKPLEELAETLGAAVGASRGACDAGYCDYALQIGQTGKVVTPEIYIACGISGAIQHLAGMSQSRVIIAINKDPEAPIFKVADYGIVGDLFEVVPLLTAEFRKVLV
ncbi:electron transfer flavoprotein subunit alpha/FixB family protein [Cohnella lubricantis]|uniref:Electron transfer flavoprotein subunit alpha/FixB family protein n=1 Tax=Cohnella lubricantis TaxID=2163172 RepID=A0A841T9I5_9BACL|nr:electron transfer flavoprotein subunit alpha/FixB family protein [Cohnella lubricantis]MBB6678173.1 electron transfer flavoprotein subunit alpha/FixB family protein [Cohnella lubricantis]MBP2119701.1 electron transfer flavoprotein alpha subunit [Cohnella lubricantis]